MPLRADVRRAKRAELKNLETLLNPPPKFAKRHCRNCPKFFNVTKPNNNPPQAFCSDECRKQYEHFGCAFGPLRVKLEKWIRREVAEQIEDAMASPPDRRKR